MNQYLVMAAAEKLAAIQPVETYFGAIRGSGNLNEALSFLSRSGGEPPRSGGEIAN